MIKQSKSDDTSVINTFISQLPSKLRKSFELKFVQETMIVDLWSATFYSLITQYKRKHHLLSEDQAEYYFESLFILAVQAIFCSSIMLSLDEHEWTRIFEYERDFKLNLVLFFTSFVLHFASIGIIRNGIQMCRFTVYHSDQIQHPIAAFMLGIGVIFVNMLCELTNTFYTMSQVNVINVITKFIGFMCLIQS